MFNLDFPKTTEINYLTKFSGWYIPENNHNIQLSLYLNEKPYISLLHGGYRPDVAAAFPDKKYASQSGFWGELLLPENLLADTDIKIEIFADSAEKKLLFQNQFQVVGNFPNFPQRQKKFNLEKLLICPECGQKAKPCHAENCPVSIRGNTPHLLQPGDLPFLKLTETETTHPYSEGILKVLNKIGNNGIVLDFGAGNTQKEYLKPNICYLDVQQYQYTDIVCSTLKLPFPDNCFDGIISHAVFEHLPNPFITAKELYRILKPGGLIFIDTAFLQPLHADPSHYFNMTVHGLRQVLLDFEEINSGIFSHHYPSYSMMMLIQTIWPHIQQKEWQQRLEDWHAFLVQEGDNLDMALGEKGREILAAGVFFEGKKSPIKQISWHFNREIPHFLIIGGQKCGTNSLYNYIVQHPSVAPSLQHEVHYFDLNFDKGLDWYQSQFPELKPGIITGESSPYYLFHPLVPQRVFDIYPQIKLIILLRNPVERAISHYYHEVKLGYESLSFSEAISSETTRLTGEVEKIIKTGTYYSFNHQHYTYLSRGIYIEQLQNWMKNFPKEQFLILKSEDLFSHPRETMNKVFQFLELPPHYLETYLKYNPGEYLAPSDQIYQDLVEYFQSFNQKLSEYLSLDLEW
ncbi:MAG: sulfotransferase domain-containing protein [Microcoleaceae cyanobacterium MO_207.B10]|nr:sulfotransferase domain-containing protein [Microcoleaceae cyanobacterium MO_207.B10]